MKDMSNYASVNYTYDNCSVSVEGGWYNAEIEFEASFYAVFENGYVRLKDNVVYDCGKQIDLGKLATSENTGINISNVDGYGGEIEYFINCVKEGKAPEIVIPESSAQSISLVAQTREKLTTI